MKKVIRRIKNLFSLFTLILLRPLVFILLVIIHNLSIIIIILLDNPIKTIWLIIKDILNNIWNSHIYPKWELIFPRTKHHIWVTICLIWDHKRDKTLKCILVMSFIINIMSIITPRCLCTKEILVIIRRILAKILLLVMGCLNVDLILY